MALAWNNLPYSIGHDKVELTEPGHLLPICLVAEKCMIPPV